MKPHIYYLWGVWNCRTFIGERFQLGCGYTPAEAYAEWLTDFTNATLRGGEPK